MPRQNRRMQRMRNVASVLYSLETIQRRIQQQRFTAASNVSEAYRDLTVVQMQVLLSVMAHQPVTIKRLAELRKITSSAATQAVDLLVNKGFAIREQDENDRRSTLISLAPNYQQRVSEFMHKLGTNYDVIFDMLDDKELEDYAKLCEKIVDHENQD